MVARLWRVDVCAVRSEAELCMVVENGAVASAGALVRELVVNDIRIEHEIYINANECQDSSICCFFLELVTRSRM